MIQNIVLDMGNVLLYYDPEVPLDFFCESEASKNVIRKELFEGPEWAMGDRGDISDRDRYDLVKVRVPGKYHEELKRCVDGWDICMTVVPGAREFCKKMRKAGKKLYVLSNASDRFYDYFTRFLPLDYFDGVVVSADVRIVKPDPGIYQHLLDTYTLNPEECLFIDDREDNVEGARQVGMQVIQFRDDFGVIEELVASE